MTRGLARLDTTPRPAPSGRDGLTLDRLAHDDALVEVLLLRDASFGTDRGQVREPHRHDYHELLWIAAGDGHHLVDGAASDLVAGTVTLIARGQVHVMERAQHMTGAVVRFREEMLADGGPGWLLHGRQAIVASVPPSEHARLDAVIAALDEEAGRPADPCSVDLQRHLLSAVLLLVQRWFDASRRERPEPTEAGLHRRFSARLEQDFAGHHDAAHYARALAVSPAALTRALGAVTGRSTKELITDRVMLEASRLLLFTDQTVGEIAYRVGFRDQLYFSRAFKRHTGAAPTEWRAARRDYPSRS